MAKILIRNRNFPTFPTTEDLVIPQLDVYRDTSTGINWISRRQITIASGATGISNFNFPAGPSVLDDPDWYPFTRDGQGSNLVGGNGIIISGDTISAQVQELGGLTTVAGNTLADPDGTRLGINYNEVRDLIKRIITATTPEATINVGEIFEIENGSTTEHTVAVPRFFLRTSNDNIIPNTGVTDPGLLRNIADANEIRQGIRFTFDKFLTALESFNLHDLGYAEITDGLIGQPAIRITADQIANQTTSINAHAGTVLSVEGVGLYITLHDVRSTSVNLRPSDITGAIDTQVPIRFVRAVDTNDVGTDVEANVANPTEQLNTIQIDGIVYSLPTGGGTPTQTFERLSVSPSSFQQNSATSDVTATVTTSDERTITGITAITVGGTVLATQPTPTIGAQSSTFVIPAAAISTVTSGQISVACTVASTVDGNTESNVLTTNITIQPIYYSIASTTVPSSPESFGGANSSTGVYRSGLTINFNAVDGGRAYIALPTGSTYQFFVGNFHASPVTRTANVFTGFDLYTIGLQDYDGTTPQTIGVQN